MTDTLIILLCILNALCAIRTWWLCDVVDALIELMIREEEEGEGV